MATIVDYDDFEVGQDCETLHAAMKGLGKKHFKDQINPSCIGMFIHKMASLTALYLHPPPPPCLDHQVLCIHAANINLNLQHKSTQLNSAC